MVDAPLLALTGVGKSFGGLRAVADVSLAVRRGEIVALIGPNGAGKTTLFALIAGFLRPDSGAINFDGNDITGLAPERNCEAGLARTFQIVQPFAGLSVRDNIAVGAHLRHAGRRAAVDAAGKVAELVGLGDQLDKQASDLTIAGRKRLELARALATEPKMLLLDEVFAGLNPSEIAQIVPVVRALRERGVTLLLIEHVMQAVVSLAERAYVLNEGRMIAEGTPAQIAADAQVVEAYLGHGAAQRLAGGKGAVAHA